MENDDDEWCLKQMVEETMTIEDGLQWKEKNYGETFRVNGLNGILVE